jgi:hypothetical protein
MGGGWVLPMVLVVIKAGGIGWELNRRSQKNRLPKAEMQAISQLRNIRFHCFEIVDSVSVMLLAPKEMRRYSGGYGMIQDAPTIFSWL